MGMGTVLKRKMASEESKHCVGRARASGSLMRK